MGIRTPVSHNDAMILGATEDRRQSLSTWRTPTRPSPPAVTACSTRSSATPGRGPDRNRSDPLPGAASREIIATSPPYQRVLPASIAKEVHDMLEGVVVGHRHRGRDLRRRRRRQDGHDHQLRRRVVCRLDAAADDRGMGRVPRQARADEHALQRRSGRGREYPALIWHDFMSWRCRSSPASSREPPKGRLVARPATPASCAQRLQRSSSAASSGSSGAGSTGNTGGGAPAADAGAAVTRRRRRADRQHGRRWRRRHRNRQHRGWRRQHRAPAAPAAAAVVAATPGRHAVAAAVATPAGWRWPG